MSKPIDTRHRDILMLKEVARLSLELARDSRRRMQTAQSAKDLRALADALIGSTEEIYADLRLIDRIRRDQLSDARSAQLPRPADRPSRSRGEAALPIPRAIDGKSIH